MYRLRPLVGVALQIITGLTTVVSIVLDISGVAQGSALGPLSWQVLALIGFLLFIAVAGGEQMRLRVALNPERRNRAAISLLTTLAIEGNRLPLTRYLRIDGGGVSEKELREAEGRAEWSGRARAAIDNVCAEFLADWDAVSDNRARPEKLRWIIGEIRGRLR
jgi:hypothetical protein